MRLRGTKGAQPRIDMSVNIDQITSEVAADPEPLGRPASDQMMQEWQELDRLRQLMARRIRDEFRTAAEIFDD